MKGTGRPAERRSSKLRPGVLGSAILVAAVALSCAGGDDDAEESGLEGAEDIGRNFEDHVVPRGEHEIYARDYPGSGPAFVLTHGFPDNSHLHDRLVPELSGRRVIVFDFLGWGRSDKPEDHDYTFANQAEDLDAVISYFDLEEASLVGHDAGGPAVVNWALDNPDRTASLTLMNAFYQPTPALRPPPLITLFQLGQLEQIGQSVPEISSNVVSLADVIGDDEALFLGVHDWQERQLFARPEDADHFIPLFSRQFSGEDNSRAAMVSLVEDSFSTVLSNAERIDDLASFPRPVRLIWGDKDPYLSTDVARSIKEAVPDSELFVLPDAYHNLQIDEPERVAELLMDIPSE